MIDETKLIDEVNDLMDANLLFYDDASKSRQETLDEIVDLIDEQPKVGEWIPCSERLPEIAGVYRVTCLYADKVYRVKDDLFYSDRTWGYDNPNRNRKVIAWKPLEKPYEVKEND